MLYGDLGQFLGGWLEVLQVKVLKGDVLINIWLGLFLDDVDLDVECVMVVDVVGYEIDDIELVFYLMYLKVFIDFDKVQQQYGLILVLLILVYFYGVEVGDEIMVDLELGKIFVVCCQVIGEMDEKGEKKVFFEFNGQ